MVRKNSWIRYPFNWISGEFMAVLGVNGVGKKHTDHLYEPHS